MLSAEFTVNGAPNPRAHEVAFGSTVSLALTNVYDAVVIQWEILAASHSDDTIPTITRAGSPLGATASFVFRSDPGDDEGRSVRVRCTVRDARGRTLRKSAVVGAVNVNDIVPVCAGETSERDATHGWGIDVNRALAIVGAPGPAGADGEPGAPGEQGPPGPAGAAGAASIPSIIDSSLYPYNMRASTTTTTATASAGATSVVLASASDFRGPADVSASATRGDEVLLQRAGAMPDVTIPAAPVITLDTAPDMDLAYPDAPSTGAVSIHYKLMAVDGDRGHTVCGPSTLIANAPAYMTQSIGDNVNWISVDIAVTGNLDLSQPFSRFQDGVALNQAGISGEMPGTLWLAGQTDPTENGLYKFVPVADSDLFTVERTYDGDPVTPAMMSLGKRIRVLMGTYATRFFRVTVAPATVDVDPVQSVVETRVCVELDFDWVHYTTVANIPNLASFSQDLLDRDGDTIGTTTTLGTAAPTRVLVRHQTDSAQNGLYVVTSAAAGTLAMSRLTGYTTAGAFKRGKVISVRFGTRTAQNFLTNNEFSYYVQNSAAPTTLNTDPITYKRETTTWYMVYRSLDNEVSYHYVGAMCAQPFWQSGNAAPRMCFRDFGEGSVSAPTSMPSTPPAAAAANHLAAWIIGKSGNTITLDRPVVTAITAQTCRHNTDLAREELMSSLPTTSTGFGFNWQMPMGTYDAWAIGRRGEIEIRRKLMWQGVSTTGTIVRLVCGSGVVVRSLTSSSDGGNAQHSRIEDMHFLGDPVSKPSLPEGGKVVDVISENQGAAVLWLTRGTMRDCFVQAIYNIGVLHGGRDLWLGNVNMSSCEYVTVSNSRRGHGFMNAGGDSNDTNYYRCSTVSVMGHGIWFATQLNSSAEFHHSAGCGMCPFFSTNQNHRTFWNCYTEGRQCWVYVPGGMFWGGTWGTPIAWSKMQDLGWIVEAGSRQGPFAVRTGDQGASDQLLLKIGSRNSTAIFELSSTTESGPQVSVAQLVSDGAVKYVGYPDVSSGEMIAFDEHNLNGANLPNIRTGFTVGDARSWGGAVRFRITNTDGTLREGVYDPDDIIIDMRNGDLIRPRQRIMATARSWAANTEYKPGDVVNTGVNGQRAALVPTTQRLGHMSGTSAPNWAAASTAANVVVNDNECRWATSGSSGGVPNGEQLVDIIHIHGVRRASFAGQSVTAGTGTVISDTNFFGSTAQAEAGNYEVSVLLQVTAAASAGTASIVLKYTDEVGAAVENLISAQPVTSTGRLRGWTKIRTTGAANISWGLLKDSVTGTATVSGFLDLRRV